MCSNKVRNSEILEMWCTLHLAKYISSEEKFIPNNLEHITFQKGSLSVCACSSFPCRNKQKTQWNSRPKRAYRLRFWAQQFLRNHKKPKVYYSVTFEFDNFLMKSPYFLSSILTEQNNKFQQRLVKVIKRKIRNQRSLDFNQAHP